jgi:cation diffusion facilitator CzcD-associated flavoprotein CzcO
VTITDSTVDVLDRRSSGGSRTPHVKVAIVGTGFSGLGMAIRLLKSGMDDFVLFERAHEVGGTWRDNTYPGANCDVMALLYCYSFAQRSDWIKTFGTQQELYDYLRECADRFGVRPHVRFGHEVVAARWNETVQRWHIETSQGDYTANVLVTATGYLSDPAIPNLPGLADFQGEMFHSSRWNHDFDLTGKRVAVIGTGASAIQFVPAIQPQVGHLDLYQRTPPWVGPKPDKPNKGLHRFALRYVPGYRAFRRGFNKWGREILAAVLFAKPQVAQKTVQGMPAKHLAKSVPDPELRARLTPNYTAGCKRLLFSNTWYPAIQQPNVEVVSTGIDRVGPNYIVDVDGNQREIDAIILGTGFLATERPIAKRIWGKGGAKLADVWDEGGMAAYRGTTVAGFPNLFMLLGPNTTLGHSSMTLMIVGILCFLDLVFLFL